MSLFNRRKLIIQSGLVLLLSKINIAFGASIVAVRMWPSKSYTRLTIESDSKLVVKNSVISNPPRLAVDISGLILNDELKQALGQVPKDDPYVSGIRVGQFSSDVVRITLDLKQVVKPQVFTLAPISQYAHRLVFDLYPAVAADPLAELIDEKLKESIAEKINPIPFRPTSKLGTSAASPSNTSALSSNANKVLNPKEAATTALIQQSLASSTSKPTAGKSVTSTSLSAAGKVTEPLTQTAGKVAVGSIDPLGDVITRRLSQDFDTWSSQATPSNNNSYLGNSTTNSPSYDNKGPKANNFASPNNSNNKGQSSNRLIIVALDPGHGGEDPGAIGPTGTQEKNVVLSIAYKLRDKINNTRFKDNVMRAYLTRDGDYFVPLATRVKKAQQVQADLFISIHADAFTNPQARGASVFALSEKGASSASARWLADKENTSDKIGGVNIKAKDATTRKVLLDMSTNAQVRDSLHFGGALLGHVKSIVNVHKSRVEQAGFAVLKAPDIPSVLVETAFISNPEEEQLLKSASFQDDIAQAMLKGILEYFNRFPPQAKTRLS